MGKRADLVDYVVRVIIAGFAYFVRFDANQQTASTNYRGRMILF